MEYGVEVYWRFKGDRQWRIAFPRPAGSEGLVRMARYFNPTTSADEDVIVSADEIETRPKTQG